MNSLQLQEKLDPYLVLFRFNEHSTKIISSSSKLAVRPSPADLGKVVIFIEHFCEKTSTSPSRLIINAADGWQTNVDGLKGSYKGVVFWPINYLG